ncbi:ClbS/DfsB family four-helix bundle protein [Rothia aeria]|uniref:ClbS/DfsB family four-helix bundle protein n=1 Tax=Rothia aeria TaxID=172042 RepID=UPI0024491B1E|nr:ClbS/DfsB family four-helix bundle protein [Rothia sp. RSM482]
MKSYENQKELIAAINASLEKYLAEFTDIPEDKKDACLLEGERTPSEHLSYQIGWGELSAGLGTPRTSGAGRANTRRRA